MKRLIRIAAICLCQLVLTVQAGWASGGASPMQELQADNTGYVLTVGVTPLGAGTLNRGSGDVFLEGQSVLMRCQPNAEFVFDYWVADGIVVSRDREFRFIMPNHDTSLTAVCHYAPESPANPDTSTPKYTLTLATLPVNAASLNRASGEQFAEETMVYMRCNVLPDFVFSHWQVGDSVVSHDKEFYFTMPGRDVTLTAVCVYSPGSPGNPETGRGHYTVTLSTQPYGAGSFNWNSTTVVAEEEECDIYAYPHGDFTFREWQKDGQTVSTTQDYFFVMPSEDVSLVAVYDYTPANPGNPSPNFFDAATGEVIIDDFMPGRLVDELFRVTGSVTGNVVSLTVSGVMNQYDWGVLNNCPACTSFDVSRTSGISHVPSFNFNGNKTLTDVCLPSTIESIGDGAFGACPSLVSLSVHAVTPPRLGTGAFDGVGSLTVYVPAASLALYQQAEGWKDFNILPLVDEVSALTVNLPEGTDVSLYKDMFIELINTQSGQKLRYVLTDRMAYTFNSLINGTSYNVYLRNAKDEVLGVIDGIDIVDSDVSVTFTELMVPRTLTITVLSPKGKDVTDQTTITWLDAKGNFLTRGTILTNQMEGATVRYSVMLPQTLAMRYVMPLETEYTVQADNNIRMKLVEMNRTAIGGCVRDAKTGDPLVKATVVVSQMLNGLYSKAFATKTDSYGRWQATVFDANSEISASKNGYISQTQVLPASELSEDIPVFELRDISGTTLLLTLTYTTSSPEGDAVMDYPDPANVTYSVYNETTGEAITEISVQYPKIVLMESLPLGTVLRVTATSRNHKFMPVEATAMVDRKDRAFVTLPLKQLGGISATYGQAGNTAIAGVLYDADGLLVNKFAYDGNRLLITELEDGDYSLVTMAASSLFNSIGSISMFEEAGLVEGTDFVKNDVTVSSGMMAVVSNATVPYLDERKLYYTGSNTKVSINKSQVTVGQFVTVTANVDFKRKYDGLVDDVSLIFTLPAGSTFVENSVMTGKSLATYTVDGNRIIVPLADYSESVRFCLLPTKEGVCEPTAAVSFTLSGKDVVQPIGSATCNVKGLSISLAGITATPAFVVSGTAMAKSEVYVYADSIVVGRTTAGPSGRWNTTCALTDPEDDSQHEVYARVVTQQGTELLSETKTLTYDVHAILPNTVSMSFYNVAYNRTIEVIYDLQAKTCSAASYMFYSATDFTFLTDFTENDPERVNDVKLVVFLNDNSKDVLDATYNESLGKWIATGRYSMEALPTTVKVIFNGEGDDSDDGNAHCDPILDPSGYVYEAVSSNRLQGVTATVYYKETVEDMYGDLHENIVLWDAEEYGQQNPLFTDEYGMYQWDVPQGLWQVKFEKDGYQTTYSEWLPVPPPQLDVNIAMTQLRQPAVKNARAYEDGVEIEFDKFMLPEQLTTENIVVMADGQPVEGVVELLDEERGESTDESTFASKVRFSASQTFDAQEVTLLVSNRVKSYAGIRMQDDYYQSFAVEQKLRSIECDRMVYVTFGTDTTLVVQVLPAAAAAGKVLKVTSTTSAIITATSEHFVIDDEGKAYVTLCGHTPGTAALNFSVDGSDLTATTVVSVSTKIVRVCATPTASIESGTTVDKGEMLELLCETDGATIYYTLDGSDPSDDSSNRFVYEGTPIVISNNMTVRVIAIAPGMAVSDVANFVYEVKDIVTAIEGVVMSTEEDVYDLQGRKLSTPSGFSKLLPNHGILIKGRRKTVVK